MREIPGPDRGDEQLGRTSVRAPAATRRLRALAVTALVVLAVLVVGRFATLDRTPAAVAAVDQAGGEVRALLDVDPDLEAASFDDSSTARCPDAVASEYGHPQFRRIYHSLSETTAQASGDALRAALESRGWSPVRGATETELVRSLDGQRVTISVRSAPERGQFTLHVQADSICP